ncbi:MAG: D-alanine-D-alanine ligase [Parcubacteria group bacterium Gr01-1014_73]|nr:MAG: D-alanine-D-alanine ligase [Parcubacteria group bacterium Gr01-1014_73]
MSKIIVGVLRGGPSSEYEVSLQTGTSVLKNLNRERYEPRDIFIAKDGAWHMDGFQRGEDYILHRVDVVFNALHGEYGEDGKVQRILEHFGVPFTGSRSLPSAMAMNKVMTKNSIAHLLLKMPRHIVIENSETDLERKIMEIWQTFIQPSVIKPMALGSSIGVGIARDFKTFRELILGVLEKSDAVLVEEYIQGREATCGVVENFRGEEIYQLLPVEIIPPADKEFFDYQAKYSGISREVCPGNFSPEEKATIQQAAALVHQTLGLGHYSRSDFIVSPKRGIYFLEVNALPGLTNESLLPKSLAAVGCSLPDFLEHLLTLALTRK